MITYDGTFDLVGAGAKMELHLHGTDETGGLSTHIIPIQAIANRAAWLGTSPWEAVLAIIAETANDGNLLIAYRLAMTKGSGAALDDERAKAKAFVVSLGLPSLLAVRGVLGTPAFKVGMALAVDRANETMDPNIER